MARYVSRPQVVEAIQWDGLLARLTECADWAPGKVRNDGQNGIELLAGKDGAQEWVPVPVGHWLVRQPGDLSDIWPVEEHYFEAKYEAADVGGVTRDGDRP